MRARVIVGSVLAMVVAGEAAVPPVVPVTTDLWDITNGTVVTAHSGTCCGRDIRSIFGPEVTLFRDARPEGFVHFVEWETTAPVTVGSFNLFGAHESLESNWRRAFGSFALKVWNGSSFDTVFSDTPSHPYQYAASSSQLIYRGAVSPAVTANRFRAEFTQWEYSTDDGFFPPGYYGPRVIELDAFTTMELGIMGDADWDGDVDDDDLSLLLAHWGQNVTSDFDGGWGKGEFSEAAPVNDDDLSLMLANWTGSAGVPEPAALSVLAVGMLTLLHHKRHSRSSLECSSAAVAH